MKDWTMNIRSAFRTFGSLFAAMVLCGASTAPDTISDSDLVTYATKPFYVRDAQRQTIRLDQTVLGVHHGAQVVATFPCSDVCPFYTRKFIHYGLAVDQTCAGIGGVEMGLTLALPSFIVSHWCIPKVLADRKLFLTASADAASLLD